ncbi:carbohydrate porin [Coleofasciculus sp. F4-SAH-05]|uniref:carbohydrate porin n=1 Tax=Coleofasciculus sp. F4-SAH-05 TaxID=3069525 RepID=UPI0032FE9947
MRELIQKNRNTDKQITPRLRQSIWLSYLLSMGSTSAGALSLFSIAAFLGMTPAYAQSNEQPTPIGDQGIAEESANPSHSDFIALDEHPFSDDTLANEEASPTVESDNSEIVDITSSRQHQLLDFNRSADSEFPPSQTIAEAIAPKPPVVAAVQNSVEHYLPLPITETDTPNPVVEAITPKPPVVATVQEKIDASTPLSVNTERSRGVEHHPPSEFALGDESSLVPEAIVPKLPKPAPLIHSVDYHIPGDLTVAEESIVDNRALVPKPPVMEPAQHSVESILLTQSNDDEPDGSLIPENSPPKNEALTPTLDVQGAYLQQEDASARLRLRGIYPVSPNALFGAIVDLATGDDFAGTEGDGFSLSELYFAGSLPSYPNLRLIAGLMDLTSYFDRNSFAKDSTTHFFHPLFQTNPALASTGVGSRIGGLLNWNITDNVEAKAAVFSSNRNLGDFGLDAFAGEIGFRAGNGIIRATYATNEDTGRDGVFGTRNGDRENAFGINGEYFIPEIKLGLFARYGWLENSELDDSSETYNFGLNFLDLFLKDDRLGLGYAFGRGFSEDNDVWELFYDIRVSPNLRAGVTLQEREGFSETIFGFRVKTDLQLYP